MWSYLATFALLVCGFWLTFLWWTAHPSPKPRQESRYEILGEAQEEPGEPTVYDSEELKAIMQHRDPFRRVK